MKLVSGTAAPAFAYQSACLKWICVSRSTWQSGCEDQKTSKLFLFMLELRLFIFPIYKAWRLSAWAVAYGLFHFEAEPLLPSPLPWKESRTSTQAWALVSVRYVWSVFLSVICMGKAKSSDFPLYSYLIGKSLLTVPQIVSWKLESFF